MSQAVDWTQAPSYLRSAGPAGEPAAELGRVLLVISAVVVLVVAVLVLLAVFRRRPPGQGPVARSGKGIGWIVVGGIAVPAVVLAAVFVLTVRTVAAGAAPSRAAATVEVVGHRWWWEIRYLDSTPGGTAVTANELHLPVGQPVRIELRTADVIHSFWVPELAGKTDLIPGQRNLAWIEADRPGTYWGTCGEYCGMQHAHMHLTVVAEPPAAFRRWLAVQRRPAREPADPAAAAGHALVTGGACALCHTVRGTGAAGRVGPDLTHVAGRHTLAAGTLATSPGTLAAWVADPQGIKPGNAMPAVGLSGPQLEAVVAYLQSLR